ncbi:MAG: electron transport complex subunit RsxE [Clostridiales bacterium]|nr:MAG: electron transport complex subunit RsxE [Clostridiales bacterium]
MAKKQEYRNILKDGILSNNPTFVQLLGMCPTLAITTSVLNGIGMGLSVTFVLIFSNLFISILRKYIPQKVRIAAYVVIIAGFVTVVDLVIKAFVPALSTSLGLFIPLIVVNCVILARAESFASKNAPLPSVVDGFANGMGVTFALTIISAIREFIGNGTLCGFPVTPDAFSPAIIMILPSGGFLVLGFVIAAVQYIRKKRGHKKL